MKSTPVIKMNYKAINGNKKVIDPTTGVVPIIKECNKGILQTIGTGFYISRYGLVMTAKHVIEGLKTKDNKNLTNCFVLHLLKDGNFNFRKILSASFLEEIDIGIIQANNYSDKFPENPLMNLRVQLSSKIPEKDEELVTFAYPENEKMDFTCDSKREVRSNFYRGKFIQYIENSENPSLKFSHFETTIKIKSGASGGPVFHNGKVIGVNCRGWDFLDEKKGEDSLSYIVPVSTILPMKIVLKQLPTISWEFEQLKNNNIEEITVLDLIRTGHINYE